MYFPVILFFGLVLPANLALQMYVSTRVSGDQDRFHLFHLLEAARRGRRTFIRGWQRADELALRPVMVTWTVLLVVLIMVTVGVLTIVAA